MWRHDSTGTVKEVLDRFALEYFEEPRKIDRKTVTVDGGPGLCGTFRLIGGKQTYRYVGRAPGVWEIEAVIAT